MCLKLAGVSGRLNVGFTRWHDAAAGNLGTSRWQLHTLHIQLLRTFPETQAALLQGPGICNGMKAIGMRDRAKPTDSRQKEREGERCSLKRSLNDFIEVRDIISFPAP